MGREIRYHEINTTYHTFSRCRGLENLMRRKEVKKMMLEVLRDCQDVYKFELTAFQIMDNHFHFIIKTLNVPNHNISVIMQWIKCMFTKRYNKMYGTTGPFWNERFGMKVVDLADDPENYLNTLLWYLGYNPVRAGEVEAPEEAEFGSLKHYLEPEKKHSGPMITLHDYFLRLSKNPIARLKLFLQYEKSFKRRYNEYTICLEDRKKPFHTRLHRSFVTKKREKAVQDELAAELVSKKTLKTAL